MLTLSTLLGMYFMVSAGSFILFYVGLELASIPMACLVAFDKYRHHSAEAGAKIYPELHVLFCPDALWYLHGIRYNRYHLLCRYHHSPDRNPASGNGNGVLLCRTGLQAESRTIHMWTPDTYQELRPMYRLTCQSSPKVQPLSL